ncbi:MAG: hypothetical protein JO096_01075 [Alphaproteobacteria bacterium]|nr:hypothetical protein [Alphaproteobacteria bacterium]
MELNNNDNPSCDHTMWNISSNDVEHAKESIKLRRAEVEARYAEEKEALDAEFAMIETLERAASEFSLKLNREQIQAVPETATPAESAISDGSEEKAPSRWRLHLGNRPLDLDGSIGNTPTVSR